ncbi:MAG: GAF domain-containing protein [Candidatus Riflebacteria bacterium]|nr:GAF domain-containing protein [Candidatus Riflebacteria bacterium]
MVRKIYLEEVCDRENLKSFLSRFRRLTGLNVVPLNERGEVVIGRIEELFDGMPDASEFVDYPASEIIERQDGSLVRLIKLNYRGYFYGAVLLGPFLQAVANYHGDAQLPVMTDEQLDAAVESIESFFMQMIDIAAEKEALARKEKILSVLEEASNIMNSTLEFQNLLEFLMDIAIEITGATCGALLLRKENKSYLEVAVARGKYPQEVKTIRVPFGQGITGWVARNKETLNVPNVLLEPRYIETPESIYSELAVPLLVGEKLIGVVSVDSSEINAFSKDDVLSLNTLASMVTKVLENARLLANSNQKLKELSRLFSISEALSVRSLDRDGYCLILKELCDALDCNAASLMLYNSDREELCMRASSGLPEELDTLTITPGKGYHGWVSVHRKALLIQDVHRDNTIARNNFLDQFAKSLLIVPLLTPDDRLVGALGVYHRDESETISESDQHLLNTVGRIITSHFENERLFNDSRRKLDYLSTLYKVGSSVSKTLNISKLFDTILQQVQEVMEVENCSLMAYDPLTESLSLDAAIGLPSNMVGQIQVKIGDGIAGWVAQNLQPVLLRDVSKDARFANHQGRLDYKTRSVLSVPILHNSSLLGVLNVNNKRSGDAFFEDDLNLLLGISGQISQAIANASLHERTDMQVAELSLIQELGKAVNSSLDLDSVLNYFIDMTTRITDSDRATLMLFDDVTGELYVEVYRGFDDMGVTEVRLKLGEGVAGRAAQLRKPIKVDNTGKSPDYKDLPGIARKTDLTLISAPLINKDNLVGVINCERVLSKKGPFAIENLDLLETLASQASIAIENARLYHNLLNVYLETIRSLAAAIDAKDSYTHGHSRRVTDLSVGISLEMGLPRSEVDTIRHASLLHDVGKIGISEQILLKPGRLTDDEFETIKSHPHIGAGILNSIEFLKSVCEIIKHHHERYDGKGYPDSLSNEEIPLGSRIICVADSFDAITSCRPYRKPLTFDEATEEVVRCAGSQFDPQVVEAFVRLRSSKFCPPWFSGEILDHNFADEFPLQL